MDEWAASDLPEAAWQSDVSEHAGRASPEARAENYTIGDLAREFGLTQRALRFYENKGLIAPRRNGTIRTYSKADRERLALIARGKRLGFTLAEIRDMIAARDGGLDGGALDLTREKCIEQINLLSRQKRELEAAINELREIYTSFYTRRLAHELHER
jgi:DNA-binding transcriptional MerR regulator